MCVWSPHIGKCSSGVVTIRMIMQQWCCHSCLIMQWWCCHPPDDNAGQVLSPSILPSLVRHITYSAGVVTLLVTVQCWCCHPVFFNAALAFVDILCPTLQCYYCQPPFYLLVILGSTVFTVYFHIFLPTGYYSQHSTFGAKSMGAVALMQGRNAVVYPLFPLPFPFTECLVFFEQGARSTLNGLGELIGSYTTVQLLCMRSKALVHSQNTLRGLYQNWSRQYLDQLCMATRDAPIPFLYEYRYFLVLPDTNYRYLLQPFCIHFSCRQWCKSLKNYLQVK